MSIKDQLVQSAQSIVRAWDAGMPLTAATIKEAQAQGFSQTQAEKLVQFTNVAAHLHKFNAAGPEDRVIQFEVAEPQTVLDALFPTDTQIKMAGAPGWRSPEAAASDYHGPPPWSFQKTAAPQAPEPRTEEEQQILRETTPQGRFDFSNPERRDKWAAKVHKLAAALKDRTYQACYALEATYDALADSVIRREIGAGKLAQDFRSLYGEAGDQCTVKVLGRVHRKYLPVKVAEPRGSVVLPHPVHRKMAAAIEAQGAVQVSYLAWKNIHGKLPPLYRGA